MRRRAPSGVGNPGAVSQEMILLGVAGLVLVLLAAGMS
jgi:hypothetical protein